jgi:hypothetical protein
MHNESSEMPMLGIPPRLGHCGQCSLETSVLDIVKLEKRLVNDIVIHLG